MLIDILNVYKYLDWLKLKLHLDSIANRAKHRQVKRGQVYRCNFGEGIGSEMQKERPAVILQNDIANIHSGNTIVAPITHDSSTLPCMVPITTLYESDGTTIKLNGSVNTSNIMCVSKARLGNYVADLPSNDMKKVDEATAKSLDLIRHYASLSNRLQQKLTYIETIKRERNDAQDSLKKLYEAMKVTTFEEALTYINEKKD